MPILWDNSEVPTVPSLFGDELKRRDGKVGKPRQQAVHCAKCGALDSMWFEGNVLIESKRCVKCGGALTTSRARSAKLKLYDAIMDRARVKVIEAAHGNGDIDAAVDYAEYAAHTAFKLQLVPYGPEPRR